MRATPIESMMTNAVVYAKDHYAVKIIDAAQEFSKATYQHSALSLREFEVRWV